MIELLTLLKDKLTTYPQLFSLAGLVILSLIFLFLAYQITGWLKRRPRLLIVKPRIWAGDVIKDAQDKEVILNIEFQIKNCSTRDNSVVKIKAGFETAGRGYEKSVDLMIISKTSYFYVLPFTFLHLPELAPGKPYVLRIEITDRQGKCYFCKYPVKNIDLSKFQEPVSLEPGPYNAK